MVAYDFGKGEIVKKIKLSLKVCAHRGASGTHPENTVAAFDEALRIGAHMIEFDVRRTLDGKFVIMHDSTVNRTTDGGGAVAELMFDYIRSLDAGMGQKVPTLDETMAYAERIMLNIHAYPESRDDALMMAKALAARFAESDIHDRAFVASDDQDLLKHVRIADSRIRLCKLFEQADPDYVRKAISNHSCEVLQPCNEIVTTQLVNEAHAHGLKVNPFFADDEDEMRRLIDCGVDGILTNYPARLLSLLETIS